MLILSGSYNTESMEKHGSEPVSSLNSDVNSSFLHTNVHQDKPATS